jgi:MoaA/NifB/PqqE/SkfB family radical SAM enzyme
LGCQKCSIWQRRDDTALRPEEFEKLPSSLKRVNICGGEPFLRRDLLEVVEIIKSISSRCRIVIFTTGSLPQVIEKTVEKMSDVGIRVLIAGSEKKHDRITGVEGSFFKAVETLRRLKKLNLKDLGINTDPRFSQDCFSQIKKLAEELCVGLILDSHHPSLLSQSKRVKSEHQKCIHSHLDLCPSSNWVRGFLKGGWINNVRTKINPVRCEAGINSFFMQPNGDIFPCSVLNMKMGNIKENTFDEIFLLSEKVRQSVKKCTHRCWEISASEDTLWSNPITSYLASIKRKFRLELSSPAGDALSEDRFPEIEIDAKNRLKITDLKQPVNDFVEKG